MAHPVLSTIAQLLYPPEQALDFNRIVNQLETVLTKLAVDSGAAHPVRVVWDFDDLAWFDVAETRILLAFVQFGRGGHATCLTLSVGPSTRQSRESSHHATLCSRLVELLQARYAPEAILWQEIEGPVDADVVDDLFDNLPELSSAEPVAAPVAARFPPLAPAEATCPDAIAKARIAWPGHARPKAAKRKPPSRWVAGAPDAYGRPLGYWHSERERGAALTVAVANDRPQLPRPRDEAMIRVREALYPTDPEPIQKPSTPMRLATHCLNATLIVIYPPMGAAVMTYSILRGEDFRLSLRWVAVVGAILSFAHSPLGTAVQAMARS
ncbi:hypothetical protein GC209_12675 [bacterium]|nr:hypothetical protein [bacterium]